MNAFGSAIGRLSAMAVIAVLVGCASAPAQAPLTRPEATSRGEGSPGAATTPSATPTASGSAPASERTTPESLAKQVSELLSRPSNSVKTADSRAELLIQPGSLPTGIALSDIKMTRLHEGEIAVRFDDQPALFAYRLEPDGLRFAAPQVLRISVGLPPSGAIPLLFTRSGNSISNLAPLATEVDLGSRLITFTIQISHFSEVGGGGTKQATITLSPDVEPRAFGELFEMQAQVQVKWNWAVTYEGKTYPYHVIDAELHGRWETHDATPGIVRNAPPNTLLRTETFTVRQSFWCDRAPDTYQIVYEASLFYHSEPVGTLANTLVSVEKELIEVKTPFANCTKPVSPVLGIFDQTRFTTTYSADVRETKVLGAATWSGTNCGTTQTLPDRPVGGGNRRVTFQWTHPHPPCDPTTDHRDVQVALKIPINDDPPAPLPRFWKCFYQGAASGTGDECFITDRDY